MVARGPLRPTPRTDGRRLDRKPRRAPLQVQLELGPLGCVRGPGLGAHADQTAAQPPLQRAEGLPFQAIQRVAVRMPLRDRGPAEPRAPAGVVAVGARQVELAHPRLEQPAAAFARRIEARVGVGRERQSARGVRHVRRQRESLGSVGRPGGRALVPRAARRDPFRQTERPAARLVPARMAGGRAAHRGPRAAVAVRAGPPGLAVGTGPRGLALADPEHAGVRGVVALHRACRRGHRVEAGPWRPRTRCRLRGGDRHREHQRAARRERGQGGDPAPHSTTIDAVATIEPPRSSSQRNSSVPLRVATVVNARYGLAVIAGKSAARKTSTPS